MSKYELIIAGLLLSVSTGMKIATLVILCQTHVPIEELPHESVYVVEKKQQTKQLIV